MKRRIPIQLQAGGNRQKADALAAHLNTDLLEIPPSKEAGRATASHPADRAHQASVYPLKAESRLQEADGGEHTAAPVYLAFGADGLTLTDGDQSMRGDFTKLEKRLQYHNLTHELLVKATKIKGRDTLHVIDATAGMGEDSLLLAASGCYVTLYEQDPIIAALLADTMQRALEEPALHDIVARMQLVEGNSSEALQALSRNCAHPEASTEAFQTENLVDDAAAPSQKAMGRNGSAIARPDVIYLDPMFPERQKSGLVKKKFQLLHYLEAPAEDEDALMQAAIAAHPFKIVVKRPAKGPYLAGQKPSYSLNGKAIRYDCYVFPENA